MIQYGFRDLDSGAHIFHMDLIWAVLRGPAMVRIGGFRGLVSIHWIIGYRYAYMRIGGVHTVIRAPYPRCIKSR